MEHATPASERILHIKEKRICLDSSAVLYARPFDEQSLREDFEATGGQWRAEADGWIVGETKRDGAGILYSRASYEGDILLDFIAQPVPPCCNDLNFAWKASGWNYEKDDADKGYIGGLGGWWLNRAGIEKYPGCVPFVSTSLYPLEAAKTYHIQVGSVGGHCFLFANGALVVEMIDPQPQTLDGCGPVRAGHLCVRHPLHRADGLPPLLRTNVFFLSASIKAGSLHSEAPVRGKGWMFSWEKADSAKRGKRSAGYSSFPGLSVSFCCLCSRW